MDPVTHALAGAAAAAVVGTRGRTDVPIRALMVAGAVAAVLPDLDRLIASTADPLLHIEYHRHFTHALAFVPIGGVLATLPWLRSVTRRSAWRRYLAACTVAWLTHGLLDASTTYGTLLWWPFSYARVAWNMIAIVDPVFTAMLLLGVAAGWRARRIRGGTAVAVVVCFLYLAAGAWQRERAADVVEMIAASREHEPIRAEVFPGFATNVVWRTLYEADGVLYMDRVRVPWIGAATWRPGTSVPAVTAAALPRDVLEDARLREDYRRFAWFSNGWIARDVDDPTLIGDARYSRDVDQYAAVWGIRFVPDRMPPIAWVDFSRGRRVSVAELWREVVGRDPSYRSLPRVDARPSA